MTIPSITDTKSQQLQSIKLSTPPPSTRNGRSYVQLSDDDEAVYASENNCTDQCCVGMCCIASLITCCWLFLKK